MADEYILPLGLDATPLFNSLDKVENKFSDVQNAAKASGEKMQQVFSTASDAAQEVASATSKTVTALADQGKAADNSAKILKNYTQLLSNINNVVKDVAASSQNGFDDKKLKQYQVALDYIYKSVSSIAQEQTEAFSTEQLQQLDAKIKNASTDLEQFQAILQFVKENNGSLNLSSGDNQQLLQTIEQVETVLSGAGNEAQNFEEKLGKAEDTVVQKSVSLRAQLRALRDEMGQIADETDPRYKALLQEAGEIKDRISDMNQQISLVGSDTKHLDAFIQGAQGIVGVFTAAQGAMALFGDQDEQLQKTMVKLTAAMSILQGLQTIGQLLDQKSALNSYLLTVLKSGQTVAHAEAAAAQTAEVVATEALVVAEEEATVATWSLNAAMEANPAGVLLLVIGALVAAFVIFGQETDKEITKQKNLADAMAQVNAITVELAKSYTQLYSQRTTDAQNALNLAQAQGKSESQIYDLKQKAITAKRLEGVAILANLGLTEKEVKFHETEIQMLQEELHGRLLLVDASGKLSDADQKAVDALKARIQALQAITNPGRQAVDQVKQAEVEAAQEAAARQKQLRDEGLKSATALAEGKVTLAEKGSKQELDLQIAAIRTAANEQLANVNLTSGERYKIEADTTKKIQDLNRQWNTNRINDEISTQQTIVNKSLAGSQEEYDSKIKILELQSQAELNQDGLTAAKKLEITSKLQHDQQELTKQFTQKNAVSEDNTITSALNKRLYAVQEGSTQELDIQRQLIDVKADIDKANAQATITNEKELTAKLFEIDSKAVYDKKKLDEDYLKNSIQQANDLMNAEISLRNAKLQGTVDDPRTSDQERFDKQQQIRQNELTAITLQKKNLEDTWKAQGLTFEQYQTQLTTIEASEVGKRNEIMKSEVENVKKFNLGNAIISSLGLNPNDPATKQFISDFTSVMSNAFSNVSKYLESSAQDQVNAIQKIIDSLNTQISTQEQLVQTEQDLSDKGLANDLANQQAKLDDLKTKKAQEVKAQQDAQKKLAEIRKQEAIMQSASIVATNIETGVNMINAMSKIFQAHAGIPFVGVALAAGFGALMLSTFLSVKSAIKAATSDIPDATSPDSSTTPTYRDGGGLLLDGPSHENGGIGLYAGNTKIAEYEGGEYLFAINKNSKPYLPLLEAINNNDQDAIMAQILTVGRLPMDTVSDTIRTQRQVDEMKAQQMFVFDNPHLSKLQKLDEIADILNRPQKTVRDYGDYIEEQEGNITRRIRKNK